jgi:hypothetical protein
LSKSTILRSGDDFRPEASLWLALPNHWWTARIPGAGCGNAFDMAVWELRE